MRSSPSPVTCQAFGCQTDFMEAFAAVPVAERKDHAIGWVAPLSGERWLITRPEERELLVVDGRLQPIWHLRLPSTWRGIHAVTEDLSLAALSLQDEVLLLSGAGREVARFAHPAWGGPASQTGCCAFAPDKRYLWATVPTQDDGDALWLVDANQPSVLDRRLLDAAVAGYEPFYHPDGQTIGLSIGQGQDASLIRWARASRGRIELRFTRSIDRVLVDVHPSGREYLTIPSGNTRADDLVRHRFVDDAAIDGLSAWDTFPFGGEWDFVAGYLTDDLILAGVAPSQRHVLVQRAPLRLLGTMEYPGDDAPGGFVSSDAGTWLTVGDDGKMIRWLLPQSEVPILRPR
jgi:hypothetical protein